MGVQPVAVGSESASRISEHWYAVRRSVEYGDNSRLANFHGRRGRIQSEKQAFQLETDPVRLAQLADAGELSFDSMYDVD